MSEKTYTLTCRIDCHAEPREIEPEEAMPEHVRIDGHRALIAVQDAESNDITFSVRGAADQDDEMLKWFRLIAWAELGEQIAADETVPPPVRDWMRRTMRDFDKRFTRRERDSSRN